MTCEQLVDARLRLDRAVLHGHSVKRAFDALPADAQTVRFGQEFNGDDKITVFVDWVPTWPDEWALDISEAFFNLRAALDYLAYELREWNLELTNDAGKEQDARRVQYPIALDAEEFHKRCKPQWRDMHPDHVAFIETREPYTDEDLSSVRKSLQEQGRDELEILTMLKRFRGFHVLAQLRRLNDEDKHRFLKASLYHDGGGVIPVGKPRQDCKVKRSMFVLPSAAEPTFHVGMKWCDYIVEPTGPNPKVETNYRIEPVLGWGGIDALEFIPRAADFIEHEILRPFDEVFLGRPLPTSKVLKPARQDRSHRRYTVEG